MKITTDHEEIRSWAEKYNATPQILDFPDADADTHALHFEFPGYEDDVFLSDREHRNISWEDFFDIFEDTGLASVYDNEDTITDPLDSFHFIKRNAIPQTIDNFR